MKKFLVKSLLATGIIFSLQVSTTFASEIVDEKINIPIKHHEVETPEFLVNGAVKDVTQKILPISVEARYFAPHMDLSIKTSKIFHKEDKVTLKNTLGFGNDNAPEVIFRYKRFTADYLNVKGIGTRQFLGDDYLTVNGKNYNGTVNSSSEFNYLKLQVTNPIIKVLGSGVDWSYGISGIFWRGNTVGTEQSTGRSISESKKVNVPIPTIGVGAHASLLDTLLFNVHLSGMPLGGYGNFYDFEAGIRYNPIDLLSISVGYRRIHADLKHNNDIGTLDLDGPYAGLRFDF